MTTDPDQLRDLWEAARLAIAYQPLGQVADAAGQSLAASDAYARGDADALAATIMELWPTLDPTWTQRLPHRVEGAHRGYDYARAITGQ